VADHQGCGNQRRVSNDEEQTMPVLRQILGKVRRDPSGRGRNYIANKALGTKSVVVHENIIDAGVTVPWHTHVCEEIIVVLAGRGEYCTETGNEVYQAGDVMIVPAGVKHSLINVGEAAIRQICFFPCDPNTQFAEGWRCL
jgi:quercetin dioxygenase-like cupin family protein